MKLVFIHGAGCTNAVFAAQLEAFAGAVAPLLPGHDGRSDGPATVAAFADALEPELGNEPAVLCGHSMGGAIAFELALRGVSSVRAIVLLDSGAKLRVAPSLFEQLERDFPAAARTLAAMFFADPQPERVEQATEQMLAVGQAQTVRDFRACDGFDATERLPELRVPLLAITGDLDRLTPPKYARLVADRVPVGTARILEQAGHFAMVERPVETNALIGAFVRKAEGR